MLDSGGWRGKIEKGEVTGQVGDKPGGRVLGGGKGVAIVEGGPWRRWGAPRTQSAPSAPAII